MQGKAIPFLFWSKSVPTPRWSIIKVERRKKSRRRKATTTYPKSYEKRKKKVKAEREDGRMCDAVCEVRR